MSTCGRRYSTLLKSAVCCWLGLSVAMTMVLAQTAQTGAVTNSVSSTSAPTQLQTFQAERLALGTELEQLIAQGATPEQLETWQQQNAIRIAAQQQRVLALFSQPAMPVPYITDVQIPAGASQTMQDFLQARANLMNLRAQIYNQQLQTGVVGNEAQIEATFQQQNMAAIQAQAQRAQVLSEEADQQAISVPLPTIIPAGASPQLQAFIRLRDQLIDGEILVHNQNLSVSPVERAAALQQWRQQNASLYDQFQAMAQNLGSTSSN